MYIARCLLDFIHCGLIGVNRIDNTIKFRQFTHNVLHYTAAIRLERKKVFEFISSPEQLQAIERSAERLWKLRMRLLHRRSLLMLRRVGNEEKKRRKRPSSR